MSKIKLADDLQVVIKKKLHYKSADIHLIFKEPQKWFGWKKIARHEYYITIEDFYSVIPDRSLKNPLVHNDMGKIYEKWKPLCFDLQQRIKNIHLQINTERIEDKKTLETVISSLKIN